jgi:hypothetical protein
VPIFSETNQIPSAQGHFTAHFHSSERWHLHRFAGNKNNQLALTWKMVGSAARWLAGWSVGGCGGGWVKLRDCIGTDDAETESRELPKITFSCVHNAVQPERTIKKHENSVH